MGKEDLVQSIVDIDQIALHHGDSHQTCWDETRGVCGGESKQMVTYSQSGHIMKYDVSKLHRMGFIGIVRGTVFEDPFLWAQTFALVCVATLLGFLLELGMVDPDAVTRLETVADRLQVIFVALQAIGAFFLGFFIQESISRYTSLRFDVVGGLHQAFGSICMSGGQLFQGEAPHFVALRRRVLRYVIASHVLLFKEARADKDLDDLVLSKVLTPEEVDVLSYMPQRAQTMVSWILTLFDAYQRSRPLTEPDIHYEIATYGCAEARSVLSAARAKLDAQLPFPYVAFMTLLIKLAVLAMTIQAGMSIALTRATSESIEGTWTGTAASLLLLATFAIVYQGCFNLNSLLANPFGFDPADFPESYMLRALTEECVAQLEGPTHARKQGNELIDALNAAVHAEEADGAPSLAKGKGKGGLFGHASPDPSPSTAPAKAITMELNMLHMKGAKKFSHMGAAIARAASVGDIMKSRKSHGAPVAHLSPEMRRTLTGSHIHS